MTNPPAFLPRARRLWDALFGAALAAPSALLAALLLVALAAPAEAQDAGTAGASCSARSLLPELEATGKLAALEAAAAHVPNGEGRLFRIEKDGIAPSFLFGTMHLSDPRILALPPKVRRAFDEADRLVVETTDMLDEMKSYGLLLSRPDLLNLPAGKVLPDYLSPEQLARVTARLEAEGVPLPSIQTLQPWFFATGLMVPACETQRMAAGEKPLDLRLALDAAAAGKPVLGLESGIEQLEVMASMPMDIQIASLVATLELAERIPDVFETMTVLYLSGRIALITPLTEALMPLDRLSAEAAKGYAAFEDRIVGRRNGIMAERLRPILRGGGAFVAVGALHLPGKAGLVELLRRDGYTLTRAD